MWFLRVFPLPLTLGAEWQFDLTPYLRLISQLLYHCAAPIVFCHFPMVLSSIWFLTLNLGIIIQLLYHCATAIWLSISKIFSSATLSWWWVAVGFEPSISGLLANSSTTVPLPLVYVISNIFSSATIPWWWVLVGLEPCISGLLADCSTTVLLPSHSAIFPWYLAAPGFEPLISGS